MPEKTVVIISTAEVEKAYTGMMYAVNALKQKWMEEVTACKFIADRDNTTEKIAALDIKVDFVGAMISDLVKDGYVPMVW